jgi:RNA polymerase sigma-70 factor, ECF subfamily
MSICSRGSSSSASSRRWDNDPAVSDEALEAARAGDAGAFRSLVEPHRRELRAFCYRMAGSLAEADDLVQESLIRAWKGLAGFEGRASLRTWLYRVAWSACIAALETRRYRTLPTESGAPADPDAPMPPPGDDAWLGPCPPDVYSGAASPEARYSARESVALAFLAALQLLPPRQRAVLIARDVLGWTAEECATALDTTVASANSALQRARETMEARAARWQPRLPDDTTTQKLLARYCEAWERADTGALAVLLREDATFAMPPLPIWLLGPQAICRSVETMVFAVDGADSFRFEVTEANGMPALAAYRRGADGGFHAASLHVLELDGDRIAAITVFLDPALVPAFGFTSEHRAARP